jgi:hypothetical protein
MKSKCGHYSRTEDGHTTKLDPCPWCEIAELKRKKKVLKAERDAAVKELKEYREFWRKQLQAMLKGDKP